MVQKQSKLRNAHRNGAAGRAPTIRARARARGGDVLEGGLCGDLARRSRRGDRHEPAEPVCGVRRQARPLSQDARILSRGGPRAGREALACDPTLRVFLKRFYGAALDSLFRRRPARLFLHRHRATVAAVDDSVREFLADRMRAPMFPEKSDREGEGAG